MSLLEKIAEFFNRTVQVVFAITSLLIITLLLSYRQWIWAGLVFVISTAVLMIVITLRQSFKTVIKEREIGIVFTKRGNFDRFLDSGVYCLDPRLRDIKNTLRVKGNKIREESTVRTKRGLTVTVKWEATYHFDKNALLEEIDKNDEAQKEELLDIVYGLLKTPYGKVLGLCHFGIRTVIEQKFVSNLYLVKKDEGLLSELSQAVTDFVQEKLGLTKASENGEEQKKPAPGEKNGAKKRQILTKDSGRVTIISITFPPKIEDAIEESFERFLYNNDMTRTISQLNQALDELDGDVRKRLAEFERLRTAAKSQNGQHVFIDLK